MVSALLRTGFVKYFFAALYHAQFAAGHVLQFVRIAGGGNVRAEGVIFVLQLLHLGGELCFLLPGGLQLVLQVQQRGACVRQYGHQHDLCQNAGGAGL